MIERHPFPPFLPHNSRILILGSFPGKHATAPFRPEPLATGEDWYYSAPRNQFWPIMSRVFATSLMQVAERKALFTGLGIALADIIYSCERRQNRNSDANLVNKTYNRAQIEQILRSESIKYILFTGVGVAKEFRRHFSVPDSIGQRILPSPSPLYCRMGLEAKVKAYRALLFDCLSIVPRCQ